MKEKWTADKLGLRELLTRIFCIFFMRGGRKVLGPTKMRMAYSYNSDSNLSLSSMKIVYHFLSFLNSRKLYIYK